jgi:hypothetical protein
MGPSALSAGIFESGMYHYVLCHIRKSPLSRIWTHLPRLEGVGGPSTLSAADFDCGMYVHVLCPSQNLLLSRIWAHLPRLEKKNKKKM